MYTNYILFIIIFIFIILLLKRNNQYYANNQKKTLVLYTFHIYNKNVQYFIDNGIFKDDAIDFIIIINDPNLKIACPDYVKIINRENIGYDFGAWSEGLLTDNLYKKYDTFIFANSSVIGPITPSYYKGKWNDIFLNGLSNTIKLYGSTINSFGLNNDYIPHVQSYAFSTDIIGLQLLIDNEIFSLTNQNNNYEDVVYQKEIKMSQIIMSNNYNIGCIFNYYDRIDFKQNNDKKLGDVTHAKYFNENLHPYEVIFIKEKYIENKDWINSYI